MKLESWLDEEEKLVRVSWNRSCSLRFDVFKMDVETDSDMKSASTTLVNNLELGYLYVKKK